MESMKKKVVYAIAPPSTGHVNPMCGLVNELSKNRDQLEVIFYSDECYRTVIEKTGAQFRAFSRPTLSEFDIRPITERRMIMGEMINKFITFSYEIVPQLIADAERDQPDLILYDGFFLPTKYLIEVINTRETKGTWNRTVPKTVMFVPNFPAGPKMFGQMQKETQEDFWSKFITWNAYRKQFAFSWTFGISIYNPLELFTRHNPVLNIVSVAPELQPYPDDFDKDLFKFVGPCVSEEARSVEIKNDDELRSLLRQFDDDQKPNDLRLVYLSMGTVFNRNSFIFERAFEALKNFNQGPNRRIKSCQIRMIVSVGEIAMKEFQERIDRGELVLPENTLVRAKVPQLEVLKRADLFITHCGMNSTTEAIKFSVPIVAIPIQADQPQVARQVCDKLSFGIRLDTLNLTSVAIANAMDEVLGDSRYKSKIAAMSEIQSKYNGGVEGTRLVLDYLFQKS